MASRVATVAVVAAASGVDAFAAVSGLLRDRSLLFSATAVQQSLNGAGDEVAVTNDSFNDGGPNLPQFDPRDLPGVSAPLGFWDPLDFCSDASEGKLRFYREVELKHGRVAMLAALGFVVGEQFHPLFGGDIDVPSYVSFQSTPLQTFWPAVVSFLSVLEVFSVFSFNTPFGGELWTIRSDYEPGDLGFDPAGLRPNGAVELKAMQTKELNNGIAIAICRPGLARAFVT